MNKKVLIAVIVILLLLFGVWFFMTKKSPETTPTGQTVNTTSNTSEATLKDLLTKGVAQSCTFSTENSSGSVYISGGKVRGDFDTTVEGKATKAHMVAKDNTSYIWTDGQTTGFKMAFDPENAESNTSKVPNQEFDPSANNNYKCSAWVTDSSKFDLPAGVTFSSFEIPAGANPAVPNGSASGSTSATQCSYCNSLTGDDKTQCLTALKCN